MGLPALQYYSFPLAAFPGISLPAACDQARQLIHFPIATVCEIIGLNVRSQRARCQREYAEHLNTLRLPTAGGPQELLCIEYEALAMWLATVQDGKAGEHAREPLRTFRAQVMAAASDILTGRMQPVILQERRRSGKSSLASIIEQHDGDIAALQRAVFVGEPPADEQSGEVVHGTCPNCGHGIAVYVESHHRARIIADER